MCEREELKTTIQLKRKATLLAMRQTVSEEGACTF